MDQIFSSNCGAIIFIALIVSVFFSYDLDHGLYLYFHNLDHGFTGTHLKQIFARQLEPVQKTKARQCETCLGKGVIRKLKTNGQPYKNLSRCVDCDAKGFKLSYIPIILFPIFNLFFKSFHLAKNCQTPLFAVHFLFRCCHLQTQLGHSDLLLQVLLHFGPCRTAHHRLDFL